MHYVIALSHPRAGSWIEEAKDAREELKVG